MKKLLFSPVGGTDPISMNNCRDGSLLHICRVYKPDKVFLYMSKEILENQNKDNRYIYCLDRLCELQNREMEYEIIERPDLDRVYEFDFFYHDFKGIIDRIIKEEIGENDSLLLNISSGTPAMKSGLAVLQTILEFPCKMIQVTTPVKGMNEHNHSDFNLEEMWDLDEDNEENFESRCHEITCPTLSEIKKEEIIKRHLLSYDYGAALDVARILSEERTAPYYRYLEMAYYRYLLNFGMTDKLVLDVPAEIFPVKSSGGRKLFEYALQLKVKLLRNEYADFIRAITPLIVDLYENVLKNECHIEIRDYTKIREFRDYNTDTIRRTRVWDKTKLQGTDILVKIQEFHQWNFDFKTVKSITLLHLIKKYTDKENLKKSAEALRTVEENIRNMAAHNIISVDDNVIYQETGFHAKSIMDTIQKMFNYTDISIPKGAWNSYDKMNEYIISKM